MLADGTYEAFIVDVDEVAEGHVALSLTIIAGPHKGDVVDVRASGLVGDPLSLLGLPASVVVRDGHPEVRFDEETD